jgi:hypothetical protein
MVKTDFKSLTTVKALCAAYDDWLAKRGYEPQSADELQYELLCRNPRPKEDLLWLDSFIKQWEAVYGQR